MKKEKSRPVRSIHTRKKVSRGIRHRLLKGLRLTDRPVVQLYRGFGNDQRLTVLGTVFRRSALPRKKYRDNVLVNTLALLRLFMVRAYAKATVHVTFGSQVVEAETDDEGFFRVDIPLDTPLPPGWHSVEAALLANGVVQTSATGQVLVPSLTQYACISDIDDTFLVSHSATILKRLHVLLTENAHSRQPFEGVVAHYRLLAEANSGAEQTNAFFYVSSSEWNLYNYILTFATQNGLPDGVYLLSQLKQFRELLKTGQNKHMTKFTRIVRILETYPQHRFILLGDDTQEDPTIYASVVEHFPQQIHCVYIRQVHGKNQPKTRATLNRIEAMGVPYCYFAHSAEARQHSVTLGLAST